MTRKDRNTIKGRMLNGLVFMALAVVVSVAAGCSSSGPSGSEHADLRGGETRETLSPEYFTGPTAVAYKIAKEIPEVIDSLHCYCECKKHFGHKSLLTCYVDEHAAYCDICMDEAFMAYELHKQGKDIGEIRKAVDARYGARSR